MEQGWNWWHDGRAGEVAPAESLCGRRELARAFLVPNGLTHIQRNRIGAALKQPWNVADGGGRISLLSWSDGLMVERREIVRRWRAGAAGVLVTLVRAAGSSYRRPGARLLVSGREVGAAGNGSESAGSISGGCLEADLVRRAGWLTRDGAAVEHYSTAFDDTAEIPFGLGCGGELDCLLEPSGTAEYEALLEAMERSLRGEAITVVTRLPRAGVALGRAILPDEGAVAFQSADIDPEVLEQVVSGRAPLSSGEFFLERLDPPQRLWVLGAGDDARPLVRFAALLGWSVLVGDGRTQLARPERFPDAEAVVVLRPGEAPPVRPDDAVVLMTHSYEQDRELLQAVLPLKLRYLGLLGATHRSSLLVSEAAEMLGWPLERCCAGLHAPVGLDLGGDGPEAVALAVVAEVQACCHDRLAMARALSVEDVRAHVASGGGSRYQQPPCALETVP